MRVLLLASWFPRETKDLNGSFFLEQAQMLQAAGDDVSVLAFHLHWLSFQERFRRLWQRIFKGQKPTWWQVGEPRFLLPNHTLPVVDIEVWTRWPGRRRAERYAISCAVKQAYKKLFEQSIEGFNSDDNLLAKPQVVHAHSVFPAALGAALLQSTQKIPAVISEHRPSTLGRLGWGRNWAYGVFMRKIAGHAAVSRGFAKALEKRWKTAKPWRTIVNPAPAIFFQNEPVKYPRGFVEPVTFVHLSHLDEGKRVDLLLQAFAQILKESSVIEHQEEGMNSDFVAWPRLLIGGGNPQKVGEIKKLWHSLVPSQHYEQVKFCGQISREDVPDFLRQAQILVLNSQAESCGAVLIEAQALGLTLVATDTDGGRDRFTGNSFNFVDIPQKAEQQETKDLNFEVWGFQEFKQGVLCRRDDLESLTKAMQAAWKRVRVADLKIPAQLRSDAKERYSAEAFVTATHELYESVQPQQFTKSKQSKR